MENKPRTWHFDAVDGTAKKKQRWEADDRMSNLKGQT